MTCEDFAKATGEPNLCWCNRRFDDEGQSGDTLDRPGMRELRDLIRSGGIDRLYAVALDRLSRRMRDAVMLLDELDSAGVELRLVHQADLTTGPRCRFLRHVLAAFAEFEHEMIATRLAETRTYLKKHGRRLAGKVPYGYAADPKARQLVPNPIEAPRVIDIFRRAATGGLPSRIASVINNLGWPTKVYHSKRSGQTTGGGYPDAIRRREPERDRGWQPVDMPMTDHRLSPLGERPSKWRTKLSPSATGGRSARRAARAGDEGYV